ncbi:MAG TPA: M20/M25/M40 family metallo-hydrolase [Vicinamibacterales bacterium]|nr:M20/M25/M40 family metallo-hydrolase [Vicinamibacterales bacterium]
MITRHSLLLAALAMVSTAALAAQGAAPPPDWKAVEDESMRHYQALIRFDTSATEKAAAAYIKEVLGENGIPAQIHSKDPERPNVVARLKGSGRKRPLLLLGHIDTVTVDAEKWRFPPFGATRDGGYVYGRGAIDDKDNLTATLETMILLKRHNVPLDRDVILLAESGEEGASNLGIGYMMAEHYPEIDAEYCIAEGGDTIRERGEVRYATVQVTEKVVRGVELTARGVSGHGSVPLKSNPIAHLGSAVGRFTTWQPDVRVDETTGTYFRRLAMLASPEQAKYYRDVISPDPKVASAAADWLFEHEPRHASMVRTSVSPNIFTGGYRSNVIPSEAKARLDVRMVPGEDARALLEQIRRAIDDPNVDVQFAGGSGQRPAIPATRADAELFKTVEAAVNSVYGVPTLPSMSTYATDMWPLRAKGVQCVGIGSAVDIEDQTKGFGMHSDQERLLETELHRFVRLNWEIVTGLAGLR